MQEAITTFLNELVLKEGLFIVLVAFVLGDIIKKATPINNQYIPAIVAVISAVVAVFTPFVEGELVVKIFKGIILGWAATGGYETFRNIITTAKANAAAKKNDTTK